MNPGYLLAQSQQTSSSACRSTSESASWPPSPAAAAFFLAAFSSSCHTKSPPFPYSPHPQLICHFSETLWSATQSQPPSHTVPIHSWSVMFQLNTVVCNAKFPPPHPTFPYSPHPQLICHFSETLWSATQSHPPSPTVPIHSWSVMFQLNIVVCHAKSPPPHLSLQSPSTCDLSLLWNIVVCHTVTPIPSPPPPPLPLQSTAGHHILFKHNRLPHKAIPPPPPYPPPRHPFILLQGVFNTILYWDKETQNSLHRYKSQLRLACNTGLPAHVRCSFVVITWNDGPPQTAKK